MNDTGPGPTGAPSPLGTPAAAPGQEPPTRTIYRSLPPPPEPSSPWLQRAVMAAAFLVGIGLLWKWCGSDSYGQFGSRPSEESTVLVLLHGYGAPGDDLEGLAEEISGALPGASVLVPAGQHRVGVTGRSWVPDFQAPSKAAYIVRLQNEIEKTNKWVWEVIDEARKKGARCRNIYIGGFSQGGRMAAEVALRSPSDCDLGGVVVLSGGGFEEVQLPAPEGRVPMRVLATHGSRDGVVGISRGRATAEHFADNGHEVQWLQFDGPHTIPLPVRQALPTFLRGEAVGTPLDEP